MIARAERQKPALGRLADLVGYRLRRAHVRTFRDFAAAMAPFRMAPGELGALYLIEANPGLSQTALGRALGVERSSVVPLIDRLQERGLVRRGDHASDRRANALALAPRGVALLASLAPHLAAHEKRIAARLRPAERRTLLALLARLGE